MPVGVVVFAVAFVVYSWTAAPVAGWLDGPELVAASATLGVAHPPGHPVQVLLGHAAQLIPLGDLATRVIYVSAACVALAAAGLAMAVRRMGAKDGVAVVCGLAFAFSGAAWLQAVRPEVYGLQLALSAAALWLVVDGKLVAAGLVVGLAFANHTFMALVFAAPLAAWALAGRPSLRTMAWTIAAFVLGLASYLHLPLRALRDPLVNWGDPQTPSRIWWTVSARAFQKSLGQDERSEGFAAALGKTLAALVESLSVPGAAWLLLAIYLLARLRDRRVVALLAIMVTVVLGRAALGFDFGNPDAHGYLAPALLAGFALIALAGRFAYMLVLVPLWCLAVAPVSWRGQASSDTYAHALVDPLPPRALVVTSYFETAFQLWALQTVEGARPDLVHVDRGLATHPGYHVDGLDVLPRIGRATPDLYRPGRPVFFEPDPTLRDVEVVPMYAFASRDFDLAADRRWWARLDPTDPDIHRALTWLAYRRAELACRVRYVGTKENLARALELAPEDREVATLANLCHAE